MSDRGARDPMIESHRRQSVQLVTKPTVICSLGLRAA